MTNTAQRNKLVKSSLINAFPKDYEIKVVGGRGTAYGWVEISIRKNPNNDCQCKWKEAFSSWSKKPYKYYFREQLEQGYSRSTYMCESCLKLHEEIKEKANKVIYCCGAEYSHYYSDDGYGTKTSEVSVDIKIEPKKEAV